jgi:hypothetical protein
LKSRVAKARSTGPIAVLLFAAVATPAPKSVTAQALVLTAGVGKTTFFEDEPIYLLVRLQNVGTDTAWTYFFSLLCPAVTMSLSRGDGKPADVAKPVVDHLVRSPWRGEPVPAGVKFLQTMVLQEIAGDEWDIRSHLLPHHLSPAQYELRLKFDAHGGVPGATPLTVEAAPIVFRIRERTIVEEKELMELEALRNMGWDTTRVEGTPRAANYKPVLIRWVERRWGDQPDDPFLPFLLYNGLYSVGQVLWRYMQAGEVQRFDPDTSEVVSRLRFAVLESQKLSIAGAHLVQAISLRHPDEMGVLAEKLGNTPAGEMARAHVERFSHGQQFKQQSPR